MRRIISESGLTLTITEQGVFCDGEIIEYIDKGEEGAVYRYQDKAIKIYHEQKRKRVISLDLLKELKTISTKRTILPTEALFDEKTNKNEGYISKFLEGNKEDIYFYKKEKLLEELTYLNSDFKILGKESIAIGDLRNSNYLSNATGLYLFDCGDYYNTTIKIDTTNINKKEFQEFFLYNLIGMRLQEEGRKLSVSEQTITSIYRKTRHQVIHHPEGLSDYLKKSMQDEETLNHYVKRLIKR